MNKAQQEVQRNSSLFRHYQDEIRRVKEQKEKDKVQTDNIAKLGSFMSKMLIPRARITQTGLKRTIGQAKKKRADPLFSLKLNFNRDFAELERFLEDCIIIKYDDSKTAKDPLSYISHVSKVQTVESRVKRVLDGLNRLSLQGNNLILKANFVEPKQEEQEPDIDEVKKPNWLYSFLSDNWLILVGIAFEIFLILLAILIKQNIAVRITAIVFASLFFLGGSFGLYLNFRKNK